MRHIGFPTTQSPVPTGLYVMGVRTTVDINNCGIFLVRIKTDGLYHAIVQVGGSVCSLDAATGNLRDVESVRHPRIGSSQDILRLTLCRIYQVNTTGNGGAAVTVYHRCSQIVGRCRMYAVHHTQRCLLTRLHDNAVQTLLTGIALVAHVEDTLLLLVESDQFLYHPVSLGQLSEVSSIDIQYIKVVITVTLGLHNGFCLIPRQKVQTVLRFHILFAGFLQQLLQALAGLCVVCHQTHVILGTVQLKDIECLSVGSPRQVGMIILRLAHQLEPNGLFLRHVIDTHLDLMAGFARHGVMVCVCGGNTGRDIHLGIAGHHTLVHAVEGQFLSVRTPKSSLSDAEFIAMHATSIHNVVRSVRAAVLAYLQSLVFRSLYIKIAQNRICQMAAIGIPVLMLRLLWDALLPLHFFLFKVHQHTFLGTIYQHQTLFRIGKNQIVSVAGHFLSSPFIYLFNGYKCFSGNQFLHLFGRCFQCCLAPPSGVLVFGLYLPIVLSAT